MNGYEIMANKKAKETSKICDYNGKIERCPDTFGMNNFRGCVSKDANNGRYSHIYSPAEHVCVKCWFNALNASYDAENENEYKQQGIEQSYWDWLNC
jgi:hypothetical protein